VRADKFHKLPPKCNACGAMFQWKTEEQLGYVYKEKLSQALAKNELDRLVCLQCTKLRHHNTLPPHAVHVDNIGAKNQLSHVVQKQALIVYVVDMFDIEGTLLKDVDKLIGHKRVLVVGNKVDRLPQDNHKQHVQLEHMKQVLTDICLQSGLGTCATFLGVCLVSAHTGYGMRELSGKVLKNWREGDDVYVIGCSNTGKSTLYNAFVNLMNIERKKQLPPEAIVHHVPGSTKSLVRTKLTTHRLWGMKQRLLMNVEDVQASEIVDPTKTYFDFDDELKELVGISKKNKNWMDMGISSHIKKSREERKQLLLETSSVQRRSADLVDLSAEKPRGKFIYDTPGILNDSQLIRYLTPSEIKLLCPTLWIVPQTVHLKPGNSLFVGGIARLDYVAIDGTRSELSESGEPEDFVDVGETDEFKRSAQGIYITMMISPQVPLHVTQTDTAESKYEKMFTNNTLKIPGGSPQRFEQFPKLESREYEVIGCGRNANCCDLTLHGVGWLSVSTALHAKATLSLYTPRGEGQSLRLNPLLPYSVQKKEGRKKVGGRYSKVFYGHTRTRSPHLIKANGLDDEVVTLWMNRVRIKKKLDRIEAKEKEKLDLLEEGVTDDMESGYLRMRRERTLMIEEKLKSFELHKEKLLGHAWKEEDVHLLGDDGDEEYYEYDEYDHEFLDEEELEYEDMDVDDVDGLKAR